MNNEIQNHFKTPESQKIKNAAHFKNRERLYSAPDRLHKSKNELEKEANLHRLRIETRQMSDLRLNMKNVHEEVDSEIVPRFKCQVCTKRFHHEDALEAHFLIHSQEDLSIHQCPVCHKVCSSKLKLRLHQNKRHPTNNEMLGVF